MSQTSTSALLVLDFQLGVGDQPYARSAAARAAVAVEMARKAALPVVFSRVKFRPNYVDISSRNQAFASIKPRICSPLMRAN